MLMTNLGDTNYGKGCNTNCLKHKCIHIRIHIWTNYMESEKTEYNEFKYDENIMTIKLYWCILWDIIILIYLLPRYPFNNMDDIMDK